MAKRSEVKIGLIPCPDLPKKLALKLQKQLPKRLSQLITDTMDYTIEVYTDSLVGVAEDAKKIMQKTKEIKSGKKWDFALCLTDLPLFDGKDLILADADYKEGIGQVSIPAFGAFPHRHRVKKVLVQILQELFEHAFNSNSSEGAATSKEDSMSTQRKRRVTRQFALSFIRRSRFNSQGEELDLHLVIRPRLHAKFRVLSGMTFANRPATIIPAFKPVVAVAFATGAYGLIFPTLWELSGAFHIYRFLGLMFGAILSIVVWITVSHQLWEKPSSKSKKKISRLYNMVTLMTLLVAVISYYLALYIMFLLTTLLFVPPDQFTSMGELQESANFGNYLKLAWLAASIATFAGSIGAGLENQETVQNIMYGYRQNIRAKANQPDQKELEKSE